MRGTHGQGQVTVNVIGAGQWGPNVIRNFYFGLKSRVGAVCDRDEARLKFIADRYPDVRISTASEEIVRDPEATAIAVITPVASHYDLVKKALESGKDVFVEKPLAESVKKARELVRLAEKKNRILMVGHIFKFNSGIHYAKKIIDGGELGNVISLHAVRTNLGPVRHDVNALWDLGAHDLSIFNFWMDSVPVTVTAAGICHLSPEREDTVVASYTYPNEVMATLHASWLHPCKTREISVVGDRKMLVWSDLNIAEPIRIYDKGVDSRKEDYSDTLGSFQMSTRMGNLTIPPVRGWEPLMAECDHFTDCVITRGKPLADGEDALAIIRSLVAADRSLKSGSKVVPVGA